MAGVVEKEIFKELCENDFSFFCKQFLKIVEPETHFEWNWHLDALCQSCEALYYGEIQNLDIQIPPRMLKSIIVSVLFPCWVWTKRPSSKFLCASRSYDLSVKFNQQKRDLIQSSQYFSVWPIVLKEDQNTTHKFANYSRGFMQSVSVGGKVTGEGADFIMSDDLLDAMDSFSKSKREAACMWYSNAFYNRAQNKKKVRRLNINQRLHQKDISGHLEENHNFDRLVFPMVKTKEDLSTVSFFKDPRQEGEFLFPARYGQEEMEDDYKGLGVYGWSSQHQQTPRPLGGGIIKEEWIRFYDVLPNIERRIITADLTFKGNAKSDYVSFQCWGIAKGQKYLIDLVRGKWSYKESKDNFVTFCNKNNAQNKYIEDKANGPALISDLKDVVSGLRAWPEAGSKFMNADKVQRLHLCSQDYEMGEVYLPNNVVLVDKFVEELTSFTEKGSATGNDDMVDTSTMALLQLRRPKTFFSAG